MSHKPLKPFGGIVPVFAPVFFILLLVAIIGTALFRGFFRIPLLPDPLRLGLGGAIALIMIPFYINTVQVFMADFKTGKVVTRGTYAYCRNPIYATWIVFLLPAAALLADSWLLLALDIVLYGVFKVLIPLEYSECREAFGEAYVRYENSVSEIFPAFWNSLGKEDGHE
jgi:protein-S-isoprenylcysteine O-methyltransferase Ste14